MNDTLRLFSEFAWRTQVRQMNGDPAWREADRQYEACQRAFETRHAHNRALIREVNALLDARAGVAGVETDFPSSRACPPQPQGRGGRGGAGRNRRGGGAPPYGGCGDGGDAGG